MIPKPLIKYAIKNITNGKYWTKYTDMAEPRFYDKIGPCTAYFNQYKKDWEGNKKILARMQPYDDLEQAESNSNFFEKWLQEHVIVEVEATYTEVKVHDIRNRYLG